MNARVALLQIASQQLKQYRNGGGRMPRNPRPDQIGMGGRILSVQVAGSPRNTQFVEASNYEFCGRAKKGGFLEQAARSTLTKPSFEASNFGAKVR